MLNQFKDHDVIGISIVSHINFQKRSMMSGVVIVVTECLRCCKAVLLPSKHWKKAF